MKYSILYILLLGAMSTATLDIAPNPIRANGIISRDECKIQMSSELVEIDLYNDTSHVKCTFHMENKGSDTKLEIGFPAMEFQHYGFGGYQKHDKSKFSIIVDHHKLSQSDIKVPEKMKELYKKYLKSYNVDYQKDPMDEWGISGEMLNEFQDKVESGQYPWYVWDSKFKKNEKKIINVDYSLPSGIGYGTEYRYFNYLLNTGSGWYKDIESAKLIVNLHDIKIKNIEEIKPDGYEIDEKNKTISWNFVNLEPTTEDDIYIRYYCPKERRKFNRYMNKKSRQINRSIE